MTVEHENKLTVSIVVPTFNRRERLARFLATLETAHDAGSRFEVVVVVDGATDGTTTMLEGLRTGYPLRVFEQRNQGPAAARNRGLAEAAGEIVLFLDDDVMPVAGMIERHLEVHRRDPSAVVTGPMMPPPGMQLAPWLQWEATTLQKQYDAMLAGLWAPTPRQFYTANASVRRTHALAAGAFDEAFTRAEDVEFAYRMADRGMRFYFVLEAAVLHEPDRTFTGWLRVGYEYGRHDVKMSRDKGRTLVLRLAYHEFGERRLLNRLLPRVCAGHRLRVRAASALLSAALRYRGPGARERVKLAICSALFSLQYWQGIADETGAGARVWRVPSERASLVAPRAAAAPGSAG